MKVAVTARAPYLKAKIASRFSRTLFFVVINLDTNDYAIRDNTWNAHIRRDSSVLAARDLVTVGVDAVITNCVGPRAFTILQAHNISTNAGATGFVWDAISQFKSGHLKRLTAPNCQEDRS